MAKKTDTVEVNSIAKDVPVCQNCKAHSNNPSHCSTKGSYTGRKETCENFKR